MALQEYAKLPFFVNQAYMTQITSVQLTGESGQIRVDTLEGLAGFTPGSGSTRVSVGFVVPIGGPEYNVWNDMVDGAIVAVQVGVGSLAMAAKGKVMSTTIGRSTQASVEGTWEWEGELKKLE